MSERLTGEAHSIRRYVVFGAVAGALAAFAASALGLDLRVVAPVAGVLAALGAGTTSERGRPTPA
ncbi:MAG TPA: hypothetical protein VES88_11455 [Gemmatimonadaceae bacterium]|nr:hypothetical protein [Gemmatimonadaceae bacterium]